jgi:hypothetical protein
MGILPMPSAEKTPELKRRFLRSKRIAVPTGKAEGAQKDFGVEPGCIGRMPMRLLRGTLTRPP